MILLDNLQWLLDGETREGIRHLPYGLLTFMRLVLKFTETLIVVTPLMAALSVGKIDCIKHLVTVDNVDLDAKDNFGNTLKMWQREIQRF